MPSGDGLDVAVGPDGTVCGKGTVRLDASQIDGGVGRGVAVHKDDLIILDLS